MTKRKNPEDYERVGRPPTWSDPLELQTAIDAYFELCDDANRSNNRNAWRPYTVEGLCEVLGCCRDTLHKYETEHPEFSDAIRAAKLKIARHKVERGLSGAYNAQVAMFDLKNNHGYRDKVEHEIGGEIAVRQVPATADDAREILRAAGAEI